MCVSDMVSHVSSWPGSERHAEVPLLAGGQDGVSARQGEAGAGETPGEGHQETRVNSRNMNCLIPYTRGTPVNNLFIHGTPE